jgi:plasmid stabilization system protein ParE
MSSRFELTLEAEDDVRRIIEYVAERFGIQRAEQLRTEFVTAFRLLAERPEIGRSRPDLWSDPYRFWPLGPSLIAYRGDVIPIQIVRVARASRDWPLLRR